MRARAEYGAVLVGQIVGAAAVLLLGTREWQTVTTPRTQPFADDVLALSGRTIDGAPTALALVALAGVVAVLASKGLARRVIGALVALAGAALVWRCGAAIAAIATGRARELVRDRHPRVIESAAISPHVAAHPVWGVLSLLAAVLVLVAGVAIALRGGRWSAMSTRYQAVSPSGPADEDGVRARADASLWTALERGEDPTALDPRDGR